MAKKAGGGHGIDTSSLDELKEGLDFLKKISKEKYSIEVDTDDVDKAKKKTEELTQTIQEQRKVLGNSGQIRYFATQEKALERLTGAWEKYKKASSQQDKGEAGRKLMNWANAYRGAGYSTKGIDEEIFKVADKIYESYGTTSKSGKKGNSRVHFSKEAFKEIFDAAREQGVDITASDKYWDKKETEIKNAIKQAVKDTVDEVKSEPVELDISELIKIDETGLKKRIQTLKSGVKIGHKRIVGLDGLVERAKNGTDLSSKDAAKFISFFEELKMYLDDLGEEMPKKYEDLRKSLLEDQDLDKKDLTAEDRKKVRNGFSSKDAGNEGFREYERRMRWAQERARKALEKRENNPIPDDTTPDTNSNRKPKAQTRKDSKETGKTADKTQRQTSENSGNNGVAQNARENAAALNEEERVTRGLNDERERGANIGSGDNTEERARRNTAALEKEKKEQQEVNEERQKGSGSSGQDEEPLSYLDSIILKLEEEKKKLKELREESQRTQELLDLTIDSKDFKDALDVVYGRGKHTRGGFKGYAGDITTLGSLVREKIGEGNMSKAAAYYGEYVKSGGTDRFHNALDEDITDILAQKYKQFSEVIDLDEEELKLKLNEINKKVFQQQDIVKQINKEVMAERRKAAAQQKKQPQSETESTDWQIGLNEQEIEAVEAYIKRMKALQKEAYNESSALAQAMSLLEKIKKRDVSGLMDQFTRADSPSSAMLGKVTNMPVNNQEARNAALRSLNQEEYDRLASQQTEGITKGIGKAVEKAKSETQLKWEEFADAFLGTGVFADKTKGLDKHNVMKQFEKYGNTAKEALEEINKQWLSGTLDRSKFSGTSDKFVKEYIDALDAAKEKADAARSANVGDPDVNSLFSPGGTTALTQEQVDALHAEAAAYDDLIAKKKEYYGIKADGPGKELDIFEEAFPTLFEDFDADKSRAKYADLFDQIKHGSISAKQAIDEVVQSEKDASKEAMELSSDLSKEFGITAPKAIREIAFEIQKIFDSTKNGKDLDASGLISKMGEYYTPGKDEIDQALEIQRKIREQLRGRKIHMDSEFKQEMGDNYASVRGTIGLKSLTKGAGLDIIEFLEEMNESGIYRFNTDVPNADAWMQLYEVLKNPPSLDLLNVFKTKDAKAVEVVLDGLIKKLTELGIKVKETNAGSSGSDYMEYDDEDAPDFMKDSDGFKDNTRLSAKEKLDEAKQLIKDLKELKRVNDELREAEEAAQYADDEDEADSWETRSQDLGLKADEIERRIDAFKMEYEALKITLKDGTEIIADATNFDQVLAGIDPKQIKEASLQYNELFSAIHKVDDALDFLDKARTVSTEEDMFDFIASGYTKEDLKEMYRFSDDEAQSLFDKIEYVNQHLFDENDKVDLSSDAVDVFNEIAEIIQKRVDHFAEAASKSFDKVKEILQKRGENVEDYLGNDAQYLVDDSKKKIGQRAFLTRSSQEDESFKALKKQQEKEIEAFKSWGADKFKDEASVPEGLRDLYSKTHEFMSAFSEGDEVYKAEDAINGINEQAKKLGYTFDEVAGKWQKITESSDESISQQSSTSDPRAATFVNDIKSLEGYSSANEDFVNQLIADVIAGQKEYDQAMNELKTHIAQRQEEIRAEEELRAKRVRNAGFGEDVKALENYGYADKDFVQKLTAQVLEGTKEYDDAMDELKAHIEQKHAEMMAAAEKSERDNAEIARYDELAKPMLEQMGFTDSRPEGFYRFVEAIREEGIDAEEALKRFAETFGYVYDQVNERWARPASRKDTFLMSTIEGYEDYIDKIAGKPELNAVKIAWDKALEEKDFQGVLDIVQKINEAFRQGKLDAEGYVEGVGYLDGMDWAKYYARYLTKDDKHGHGARYLDEVPEGWKKIEGALTAPKGYEWYSNGKSRFSGEYQQALVKIKQAADDVTESERQMGQAGEEAAAKVTKVTGDAFNKELKSFARINSGILEEPKFEYDFDKLIERGGELEQILAKVFDENPGATLQTVIDTVQQELADTQGRAKELDETLAQIRQGSKKWSFNDLLNDPDGFAADLNQLADQLIKLREAGQGDSKEALNLETRIQHMLAAQTKILDQPKKTFMPYWEKIQTKLSEQAHGIQDEMWDAMANGGNLTSRNAFPDLVADRLGLGIEYNKDFLAGDIRELQSLLDILQHIDIIRGRISDEGKIDFFGKYVDHDLEIARQLEERLQSTSEEDKASDPEWVENQYKYIAEHLQKAEELKKKIADLKGEVYEMQTFTAESVKARLTQQQPEDPVENFKKTWTKAVLKSTEPPEALSQAYMQYIKDINSGAISAEDAMAGMEQVAKRLDVAFDEASQKWQKIQFSPEIQANLDAFNKALPSFEDGVSAKTFDDTKKKYEDLVYAIKYESKSAEEAIQEMLAAIKEAAAANGDPFGQEPSEPESPNRKFRASVTTPHAAKATYVKRTTTPPSTEPETTSDSAAAAAAAASAAEKEKAAKEGAAAAAEKKADAEKKDTAATRENTAENQANTDAEDTDTSAEDLGEDISGVGERAKVARGEVDAFAEALMTTVKQAMEAAHIEGEPRILGKIGRDGTNLSATYELARGMRLTGTWAYQEEDEEKGTEAGWVMKSAQYIINYQQLLNDTTTAMKALREAQAELALSEAQGHGENVLKPIRTKIQLYQQRIAQNTLLAEQYEKMRSLEEEGFKLEHDYTKKQFDDDLAEAQKLIDAKGDVKKEKAVDNERKRQATKRDRETARSHEYATKKLTELKGLENSYLVDGGSRYLPDEADRSDLQDLVNTLKAKLESIINEKRSISFEEMDQILSELGDIKIKGDASYSKSTAKKGDLSRQSVESLTSILSSDADTFLAQIGRSSGAADKIKELREEVLKLKSSLEKDVTSQTITDGFQKLRELQAQLKAENEQARTNKTNKREADKIEASFDRLGDANSRLVNAETAMITKGETPATIKAMAQAMLELTAAEKEAEEAYKRLFEMVQKGQVTIGRREELMAKYRSDEVQHGSADSRKAREDAKLEARIKLLEELQESYVKLAQAQEKAEHASTAAGRELGKRQEEQIKKRQEELKKRVGEFVKPEDLEGVIKEAEQAGEALKSAYADDRNEGISTKGLGFGENDDVERTWDTLIAKAQQYQKILYKQQSGGTLTVNEAALLQKLTALYQQAGEKAEEAGEKGQKFNEAVAAAQQAVRDSVISKYSETIGGLTSADEKMPEAYNKQVEELKDNLEQLKNIDFDTTEWEEMVRKLDAGLNNLRTDESMRPVTENAVAQLDRQMANWQNVNSGAGEFLGQVQALRDALHNVRDQEGFNGIQSDFERVKAAAADAGKTGESFGAGLKKRFKSLGQYLLSFASFYRVMGTMRQAVSIVTELNDALTEMRKVSDESLSTLEKFQFESFDIADEIGSSAINVQKSTADWLRLGESFEDAKESAKEATILFNVSEFENIDAATQSLVSASQAYKDLDKIEIIDKLNNIGNNFSISTDQLATGLQNAAAVLMTQGNDIDEALALLTAGNAITQDISKTSAGIRTISLRISGKRLPERMVTYGHAYVC